MVMKNLDRRTFLRAAGVAVALPLFESMPLCGAVRSAGKFKRFVAATNSFGMYAPGFFPGKAGHRYSLPELVTPFEPLKREITILRQCGVRRAVRAGVVFLGRLPSI